MALLRKAWNNQDMLNNYINIIQAEYQHTIFFYFVILNKKGYLYLSSGQEIKRKRVDLS